MKEEAKKFLINIPNNATNGDIMNALFDIVEDKHQDKGTINLYFFDLDIAIIVSLDWWNSPYHQKGMNKK